MDRQPSRHRRGVRPRTVPASPRATPGRRVAPRRCHYPGWATSQRAAVEASLMARTEGRTQPCDRNAAKTRIAHARKFLEVAELVASETGIEESKSCAAALAVLAGIAAVDAACCAILGRRPRGQDHRQAADLVEQI